TLLDPPWSDLELHLSGDEDLRDQGARVVTKEGYRVSMEGYKTSYARCGVWRGFGCHKGDKEVFVYLVGKCGDGGKDIRVKKSKNEQKPTRNEETSTKERFEANIKSRIKTVVEKSSMEVRKGQGMVLIPFEEDWPKD
ncbi:hypothetical protein Tco_0674362, partial [Tanacetum coccineum]